MIYRTWVTTINPSLIIDDGESQIDIYNHQIKTYDTPKLLLYMKMNKREPALFGKQPIIIQIKLAIVTSLKLIVPSQKTKKRILKSKINTKFSHRLKLCILLVVSMP